VFQIFQVVTALFVAVAMALPLAHDLERPGTIRTAG